MSRPPEIYLDIETTWTGELTVVGFVSNATGVVQLVGRDITRLRLMRRLPKYGRLFTFNGHSFDLAKIRAHLGVDLRERFESTDLRWICYWAGIAGGQKDVEERFRFRRKDPGCSGVLATRLWDRHVSGDGRALDRLLAYNREDLLGMQHIKRHLARRGVDFGGKPGQ
jgi:uncharacterized protein YprB with RNaseH-like and TPR domain